ncbi:MaoC family dehydratase N-terminal domain-containing protein [Micromonospora eburnea]|uniref:Acyl dehydratase n=1 Tax=Micromonospora eburnea TaxID=227316 RepID=A0A1C6TUR8_9ACTN|nr:MaoC family dehydratase N-terminal domain-containing protein [Micromonospora eburnea]SCL45546.1 Acyl dehydratase [Micromonospora eburnea]
MPVDPDQARALTFAPITVTVERGRLRFFAKAVGETNPVYVDLDAARQAGHRDLPVPPTFFFSLEMEGPDSWAYLAELGVDLRRVLHGEQSFTYHSMVYAGDTVALRTRIVDVYAKKGGALEFLVRRTDITRGGDLVAEATSVIVVRNPEAAR